MRAEVEGGGDVTASGSSVEGARNCLAKVNILNEKFELLGRM